MKAAWYEKQGPAKEVLILGEMADPHPGPGEVRIRVAASGVNPGDVKKRRRTFGSMMFPRIIPHSDGAGHIDELGEGVVPERLGQAVWCYHAQSYRPFGTAAEFTVVPAHQAVPLPDAVSPEQGACLGIPGLTGHRAAHVAGALEGRTVLIQGAAGAVGICAVQMARRAGARVIGTIRAREQEAVARQAGAHDIVTSDANLVASVKALAPEGIDHIVEVAFAANVQADVDLLKNEGSIATYATDNAAPQIPFWPMVFNNNRIYFLGSDDFPKEAKQQAAKDLNASLEAGWSGFSISERLPLDDIAHAHELVENSATAGRVVVMIRGV
jgi:NADPH2:quinone reductase